MTNYYFILFIIIIIIYILYIIYFNYNNNYIEKFSTIDNIKRECPVGNIIYGFCDQICVDQFGNNTDKCRNTCPIAANEYLIKNPQNIYGNFLLKYIFKSLSKEAADKLTHAEKGLNTQTQISSAVSLLTRPGSNWKKIESVIKTDLNDDENIQNNISPTEFQKFNIIKLLKESLILNNTTFNSNTTPTIDEIFTLFPNTKNNGRDVVSLDDKYNYWIEVEIPIRGEIKKEYYKPINLKCYGEIDELLIENNFIKLNNNKFGQLWKIYDKIPSGTLITINSKNKERINTLFAKKIKNLSSERWYECIKSDTNINTDINNIDVVAKDSAFSSWLKLLMSIKSTINETDLLNSQENTINYIYQFSNKEQNILNDLIKDTDIIKQQNGLSIDNYIKIDDKYYRPLGNIVITKEEEEERYYRNFVAKLNQDSYIQYNHNGKTLYFKIIPPIISNSKIIEKCNNNDFHIPGPGPNEYVKYNKENIMNIINANNKITITELNDLIHEKKNDTVEILKHLTTLYPNCPPTCTSSSDKTGECAPCFINKNSYYNKNDISTILNLWDNELKSIIENEKKRRETINNNCAFNKTEIDNWKDKKNITIKDGLNYGLIKDPVTDIPNIDEYYIKNSDIKTIENQINTISNNCAFNKSEIDNWKDKKSITIKDGLNYGLIKDPESNFPNIDQYYVKNSTKNAKIKNIRDNCLLNNTQNWGETINISNNKYGKIKNGNNGFLIKTDSESISNYLNSNCHIKKVDKNKWGIIGNNTGEYGKIKSGNNNGEYGELGISDGKYGRLFSDGGNYGKINMNRKCTSVADTQCRTDYDFIPKSKCDANFSIKKRDYLNENNEKLADDITKAEMIYKSSLTGMIDDFYKIDDAFCIYNEKKNRYNTCITNHKKDGQQIMSYNEFKTSDTDYQNAIDKVKTNANDAAQRKWSNKYKKGPASGEPCKEGNPQDFVEENTCDHLGNAFKCMDKTLSKTQQQLQDGIAGKKAEITDSIIEKGFTENISKYANKYTNGTPCNKQSNVHPSWRLASNPCVDAEKTCISVCPTSNCKTGKQCINKNIIHKQTDLDFEDKGTDTGNTQTHLNTDNEYKKGYNESKKNWKGKYSTGEDCVPKNYVNPDLWKLQDSDDVCGGGRKCIDVDAYNLEINNSSDEANETACKKLNRDSCATMITKKEECERSNKCRIGDGAMQTPTLGYKKGKCDYKGEAECEECPACEPGQYREENGKTCGKCTKCRNVGPYEYLDGCTGINKGQVKSCPTCPDYEVKTGCNKNGQPICSPPIVCSDNEYRIGRTQTDKGICQPATLCSNKNGVRHYLDGFIASTPTEDGKNGTCKPCKTCTGQTYLTGCSEKIGPGTCTPMQCADPCPPGYIKNGCKRESPGSNTFISDCSICAAGTKQEGNTCVDCPIGTYNPTAGNTECSPCTLCSQQPRPSYAQWLHALKKDNCSSKKSIKNNECYKVPNCAKGYYAESAEYDSCTLCPENTYQIVSGNTDGKNSCKACEDYYVNKFPNVPPEKCEIGTQDLQCPLPTQYIKKDTVNKKYVCSDITNASCGNCTGRTPDGSYKYKKGCKKPSNKYGRSQAADLYPDCWPCPKGKHGSKPPNNNGEESCQDNVCSCPNGTGTRGKDCSKHGKEKCETCYEGYELKNGKCEKRPYYCNGMHDRPVVSGMYHSCGPGKGGRCPRCPNGAPLYCLKQTRSNICVTAKELAQMGASATLVNDSSSNDRMCRKDGPDTTVSTCKAEGGVKNTSKYPCKPGEPWEKGSQWHYKCDDAEIESGEYAYHCKHNIAQFGAAQTGAINVGKAWGCFGVSRPSHQSWRDANPLPSPLLNPVPQ